MNNKKVNLPVEYRKRRLYLKSPVLSTERPVTITEGTNVLVGTDTQKIIEEVHKAFNGLTKKGKISKLWDGKVSERIVKILMEHL